MNCTPKYLLFTFLILIGLLSYSQHNDFLVLDESNVNSVIQNPSNLINVSDVEFSLAPFANNQFDLVLPFSMSNMFVSQSENQYSLDFTNMSQQANHTNSLYSAYNMLFMYLSVKGKNSYWNFYIEEQFISAIGFEDTFFDFLNLGNKAYIGERVDVSIPISIMHYRNYTLSWAKQINERLDIGLSGKLFFGKSMMKIQPEFSLFTPNEIDFIEIDVNDEGNISSPVNFTDYESSISLVNTKLNISQYLFGTENPGLGVDLGINYKFNPQLSLSVNISDVGFIYWNNENSNINIDGSYKWDGIDVSGIVNLKEENSFFEDITNIVSRDSLLTGLIIFKESDYLWYTPAGIGIGLVYQKSDKMKFSIHNYIQYFDPFIREYLAVTGSLNIGEKWSVMSGLSFTNGSYFNVPLGLVFTSKRIRSTFNLSNLWGTFLPERSNRFGASVNLSFLLKHKKKMIIKSDIDYPFYIEVEE